MRTAVVVFATIIIVITFDDRNLPSLGGGDGASPFFFFIIRCTPLPRCTFAHAARVVDLGTVSVIAWPPYTQGEKCTERKRRGRAPANVNCVNRYLVDLTPVCNVMESIYYYGLYTSRCIISVLSFRFCVVKSCNFFFFI